MKARFGNLLGGALLAIVGDPQSTRAWERGARGEEKLGEILASLPDVTVLNDRRVPGTRGNIDHVVIAPAGVFVVDAKHYRGEIRVRDKGGLFKSDDRLYVGPRDCSQLADNMGWQVEAVARALGSSGLPSLPPVTPVLCFVDGEWSLFAPKSYKGVRLEGRRSIRKLLSRERVSDSSAMEAARRLLSAAFPPK